MQKLKMSPEFLHAIEGDTKHATTRDAFKGLGKFRLTLPNGKDAKTYDVFIYHAWAWREDCLTEMDKALILGAEHHFGTWDDFISKLHDYYPRMTPQSVMFTHFFGRACRECGCTDERACPEGCYWTSGAICSQCVKRRLEKAAGRARTKRIKASIRAAVRKGAIK